MKSSVCFALTLLSMLLAQSGHADTAPGAASDAEAEALPLLRVEGNRFVVADTGEPIVLRGLAMTDPAVMKKRGQWNRTYFEAAADWNANVVRLPVHPAHWRETGEEDYLALLDEAVEWATELGLYIIIDWHSIGNILTGVYYHPNYQTSRDETYRFWNTIGVRYAGNTTVAFYELFNEPTRRGGQMGPMTWEDYAQFIEGLISMLYAIDDTAIPLVAGFDWGYSLTTLIDRPIQHPGVGYVTHPYPQKRDEPWEPKWQEEWGFAADTYPLIATEFGFMSADERGAHKPVIGDEHYGESIIRFFEERGISWTAWVFDPFWTPNLIEGWDYTPTRSGRFFQQKLKELNP